MSWGGIALPKQRGFCHWGCLSWGGFVRTPSNLPCVAYLDLNIDSVKLSRVIEHTPYSSSPGAVALLTMLSSAMPTINPAPLVTRYIPMTKPCTGAGDCEYENSRPVIINRQNVKPIIQGIERWITEREIMKFIIRSRYRYRSADFSALLPRTKPRTGTGACEYANSRPIE